MKALNCLSSLSKIISRYDQSSDEIMRRVVQLIPPAFLYAETICARIRINGQTYQTGNFKKTGRQIKKEIVAYNANVGTILVCYLGTGADTDNSPFLHEEELLIEAIAERLGKTIERARAQMEAQESEQRFRILVENSLTGISIVQKNEVVYQNKEQERLLGPLPRPNIMGDLNKVHPDDIEKVKQFGKEIVKPNRASMDMEFRLISDTGKPIWINCRVNHVLYRKKDSILFNMMDMSQSKKLENLLITQDKMASLGRVAAGMAHEIRNPLSGINIYLNTLEKFIERGESEDQIKNVFRQLTAASQKIESVIRRVMDFSKPNQPSFQLIQINVPVQEALKLTATMLRKSGIVLEVRLAENLPKCMIDPQQIEEVMVNMITNAADAMRMAQQEKRIKIVSEAHGEDVAIRIIDSGPGISIKEKNKIFDPFFTTKSDSTGIGLSICHRFISDHHGKIDVIESKWGGAEFNIRIPVTR